MLLNLSDSAIEISVVSREEKRNNVHPCAQSPVRHLKEEASSLWTSPEKQYPDDFEPYETEDMEVRIKTHVFVHVFCVCVCVCADEGRSHVSEAAVCTI